MMLARLAVAALAALLLSGRAQAADLPVLTVYTYSSFIADWGPGPAVKKAFEAQCGCRVDYVAPGDAVEILTRLRLEGKATKADVVVGLDTATSRPKAEPTGLFAPHGLDPSRASICRCPGADADVRAVRLRLLRLRLRQGDDGRRTRRPALEGAGRRLTPRASRS
jgi:ABC-type thiamine transport system substrate-binding protein